MGLESAYFQDSEFQGSGEGDIFLQMGTSFSERSCSIENGICVTTWSGFCLCPAYLWLLILLVVKQISEQITRRLVA